MAKIDKQLQTMQRTVRYFVAVFPLMVQNGLIEQDDADSSMIDLCEILTDLKKQRADKQQTHIFTQD